MTFDEYQREAAKTWKFGMGDDTSALSYLALGLTGEAGEVAEYLKKKLYHHKDDMEPLHMELGDVLWYLSMLSWYSGYSLEAIAEMNIEKLRARHAT